MKKLPSKVVRPPGSIRWFLEPGPVVLVSSAWRGKTNIMTMGWHMMLADEPVLVGGYVWTEDHSREMIRKSGECVINLPTADLAATVVDIGNTSGRDTDKFAAFGLTPEPGETVSAPGIAECHASFECKLVDKGLIRRYSLFVFEVTRARVATSPKFPTTLHYRGEGMFMISGGNTSRWRKRFRPDRL